MVSGAAIVIVAITAVLAYVDLPWQSHIGTAAQNAGHVVAIGVVAVCLLIAARRLFPTAPPGIFRQYLLVLAVAAALGLLVEFIQLSSGRDVEPADFVRDLIGAAVFLTFAALVDPALRGHPRRHRQVIRAGAATVATLLLVLALGELALWSAAYVQRNQRFPDIAHFDSRWSTRFVSVGRNDLRFVTPPGDWERGAGGRVGSLTLYPSRYTGFSIDEPYPHWSGYDALAIDLYSEAMDEFSITVRVHDAAHNQAYSDRFNAQFMIGPGSNRLRIPLAAIATAPRNRLMDMDNIAGISLFTVSPPAPLTLLVGSVSLE